MRCNNCGWDNPDNSQRCEKCNAPMKDSMVMPKSDASDTRSNTPISGTVKGGNASLPYLDNPVADQPNEERQKPDQGQSVCSKCGFPVHKDAVKCPQCGNILQAAKQENVPAEKKKKVAGTVSPWDKPKFSQCFFKPLARDGENEFQEIEFTGDEIELNRENLEQNNMTITSKVQAVLKNIDGKWFLVDKSALQTTFRLISEPYELKKGDIILMGDRKFEFDD